MKLVTRQKELNDRLSTVSKAIPNRPSHPVLANVLFVADKAGQQISLTGFDLSLGIQTSFSATVEEGGTTTIPSKLLGDIVSRLPDGDVSLSIDDGVLTIECSSGKYQVRCMSADEYPELPDAEGDAVYLPVKSLIEGLRGSLFATSADETKQLLTGVHIKADPDGLEFGATNGHRLAVVQPINAENSESMEQPPADVEFAVTVPGKALRELERMLQSNDTGTAIAMKLDPSQLIFEWGNQRLTSRLLEGQYPNYRQLIPRQFTRQMTIDRRAFTSGLERIAVLADQKNGVVKLSLDSVKQELVLSVDAQDVGSGRESLPAQISGDDLDIAFNVKYLIEGLKSFTTSDVQMQFNTSTSPSILTPLGGLKATYLLMPVQIR